MTLKDKVIIVTGASRGIGWETARQLAAAGAVVCGTARTAPADPLPQAVDFFPADIRRRQQVEDLVRHVLGRAGRIDTVVHNAGVEIVKPLEEVTEDEYDHMLDTNLKAVFHLVQACLPAMKARRSGHMIFINSVAGVRGFTEDAVYCASKFGLTGFADALDEELRPHGIRVTGVHPGATNTTLAYDSWSPPDDPRRPYFLQPEDVAAAVLYAASQPPRMAVKQIVLQPLIEPPHSEFLPLDTITDLLKDA